MMNVSRWVPKQGASNKLRSSARFRSSHSKRYFRTSSGSTNGVDAAKRVKKHWLLAYAAVGGGLVMGSFGLGWKTNLKVNDQEDEARQTYLSCLGEERELPLPSEDAILTFAPEVPPPILRDYPVKLRVDMNTSLRMISLDETHKYEIWSFNGGAPGPFIRARVGDVLDISFTNNDQSGMWHNIDFHSVSGPGGGGPVLTCEKNETKSAQFKLLHPGVFIYHCAVHPVASHMANGMYGLMLVEPKEGLPKVDKEYFVVQSEFYTMDSPDEPDDLLHVDANPLLSRRRLLVIDEDRLMDENPTHVVFNGCVGSMTTNSELGQPLTAKCGERVRLFFGNAGPNLVSSFHIIGAIFDKVWREADLISPPARSLQTTLVPAGGATMVEIVPPLPGILTLLDHSIVRIDKGAVGFINVEGPPCPSVYHSDEAPRVCKPCKIHP